MHGLPPCSGAGDASSEPLARSGRADTTGNATSDSAAVRVDAITVTVAICRAAGARVSRVHAVEHATRHTTWSRAIFAAPKVMADFATVDGDASAGASADASTDTSADACADASAISAALRLIATACGPGGKPCARAPFDVSQ